MTGIAHEVSSRIGPGSVSVARTGTRTFEGMNERGSTLLIGPREAEVHFTPGELLKLALAGCAGMSADGVAAVRLGDDFEMTVWAHGTSKAENRYTRVDEELLVDLSVLDDAERTKLIELMVKAIDRRCTVARSVHGCIELETTIDGTPV